MLETHSDVADATRAAMQIMAHRYGTIHVIGSMHGVREHLGFLDTSGRP